MSVLRPSFGNGRTKASARILGLIGELSFRRPVSEVPKGVNEFDSCVTLMNGGGMSTSDQPVEVPAKQVGQVIEEDERANRQDPALRLPRQIMQYNPLVDHILT